MTEPLPPLFDQDFEEDDWGAALRRKLERDGLPDPDGTWYHLSPHRLPIGTRIVPQGGDTVWDEFYDGNRGYRERRQRWVWMEHHPQPVRDWHREMLHFAPQVYVYRVRPSKQPLPWNGNGASGWVAPDAVIEEQLAGPPELPTRTAAWTVHPDRFTAFHEMGHVMDAAGNFGTSDALEDLTYKAYQEATGRYPRIPGPDWTPYMEWLKTQLPGRAFINRDGKPGDWNGPPRLNPKEAIAAIFAEHELRPEHSTPLMEMVHQHLVEQSRSTKRPTYLPTFRPGLSRHFTDAVQELFQKYPQSRIVRTVQPEYLSQYSISDEGLPLHETPVAETNFGRNWKSRPNVNYDSGLIEQPDLLEDAFQRMRGIKDFSDWVWEDDDEPPPLTKAATSLLVGPEDAYDEWDWFQRHQDHPPIPTPDTDSWYHVSPHWLPIGTVLAPMRGTTPWNDNPYQNGLGNRANWIWVEPDQAKAFAWMHWVLQHQSECHLYRVRPHLGPYAWNGTAEEGWVSDHAVVLEHLDDQYEGGVPPWQ